MSDFNDLHPRNRAGEFTTRPGTGMPAESNVELDKFTGGSHSPFPRQFDPTPEELVAKIGHPLDTVSHTLQKNLPYGNISMDVSFAYDHWEAARFVQDDLDNIEREWQGTDQELRFIRSFVQHFAPGGKIKSPYGE